ncbi:MAG: hypothetical protein Tp152SUR00d2C52646391_34 [Prokaryotic dsDNA virus sp.]|nr:MAG: hypothetical protein Tp152SUR00d2C52646391_34 [Prokaryotic dsDNA virus sp.]|tara:strand:- start:740 stop:931 length:192 start_codon:yes stop_codon:yes gene_type:complete
MENLTISELIKLAETVETNPHRNIDTAALSVALANKLKLIESEFREIVDTTIQAKTLTNLLEG